MKKYVLTILSIILLEAASCQQKTELTDELKSTIEKEVEAQYNTFEKSLNTMDINLLQQLYSENNFLVAVFDGTKIKTYEAVIDSVSSWFNGRVEQGIDKSDIQIDVLSDGMAFVTSFIEGHMTLKSGERWEFKNHAFSLLFNRETSGWKIIYYHESDQ